MNTNKSFIIYKEEIIVKKYSEEEIVLFFKREPIKDVIRITYSPLDKYLKRTINEMIAIFLYKYTKYNITNFYINFF